MRILSFRKIAIKEMEIYRKLIKNENDYLTKSLYFSPNNNEMENYRKIISSQKEKTRTNLQIIK